ncbi:hypothetical protein FKP32DRAFT_382723 [Trametes sanguinea]|nr:hypothetical protein FKP32DRAFT_382723 [Trametes sanguinea]
MQLMDESMGSACVAGGGSIPGTLYAPGVCEGLGRGNSPTVKYALGRVSVRFVACSFVCFVVLLFALRRVGLYPVSAFLSLSSEWTIFPRICKFALSTPHIPSSSLSCTLASLAHPPLFTAFDRMTYAFPFCLLSCYLSCALFSTSGCVSYVAQL